VVYPGEDKAAGVRKMPINRHSQALEIFFEPELAKGRITLKLEWLNLLSPYF